MQVRNISRKVGFSGNIVNAFRNVFNGQKNLMTDDILSYGVSDNDPTLIYEISFGTGIFSRFMVGVTVLYATTEDDAERREDLNLFLSGDNRSELLSKALRYANSLEE